MYFTAYDEFGGFELWSTDATAANTARVTDLAVAGGSSFPGGFSQFDESLLFAATGQVEGTELFILTSTPEGLTFAALLADISPGSAGSSPAFITSTEGMPGAVFAATTPSSGRELWITDGTTAGTQLLADIYPGANSSSPANLVAANGFVYFTATSPDHGAELWRTDGTPEGTTLYADILPGPAGSVPAELESAITKLYFSAETPTLGRELWSVAIPTGLLGDMNCDGFITIGDIGGFVLALTDAAAYGVQYPACDMQLADVNGDGFVTLGDIGAFVALVTR